MEREEIHSTIRDRINAELALMQDFSVPSHERYAAEERVNQYLDELLELGHIAGSPQQAPEVLGHVALGEHAADIGDAEQDE